MFAMNLWLGNTAYSLSLYIYVSFAQMLKAMMPVVVFILGEMGGLEVMRCKMLLIMSIISIGFLVASYGEINVNWIGVVYQMGGVVGEALRLNFMEILVKRKGFLVISHTSAPIIHVAGVVKDWVVVLLLATLFADTKLTVINLLGYGIGYVQFHGFI